MRYEAFSPVEGVMTDLTTAIPNIRRLVGGRFFGATFTKRDGTERTGAFRLGVRSHLKGGSKSYDTDARAHLTVFDVNKQGYRTIRLETLSNIVYGGETFTLNDFVDEPVSGDDEWGNR